MKEIKFISKLLGPESLLCPGFTDGEGNKHTYTVIIAPITVEMDYEGSATVVKISWGCNMGASCMNPTCRYSKKYQELLKWAKEGGNPP